MNMNYNNTDNKLSILKNKLQNKEIGFYEAISCFLDNIKANKTLNCYTDVFEEDAIKKARELDIRANKGEQLGALAGIPIAIKDNIAVNGKVNSCCSNFLRGIKANSDADVIKRLKAADAILIGKTNMDEFAMGTSNETSCYGPVLNPVDNTRVPGGSSGGSACAVKIGSCVAALGTDTGGSIRQPASHCGVVGFKPTKGAISNKGIVALAPSLDQVGILSSDTDGVASVLKILSDFSKTHVNKLLNQTIKVGIADDFLFEGMSSEIHSIEQKTNSLITEWNL